MRIRVNWRVLEVCGFFQRVQWVPLVVLSSVQVIFVERRQHLSSLVGEHSSACAQRRYSMATPCTIIGSANMELEQEFRMMTLELFQQLSLEECQKLAYVSSCMKEPIPPQCDYRLHVFSTLESRGKIGPLNLDFLENTLELIGRKELLNVIMKYKKKPIYKEVRSKKKSGRSKQKGKQMHLGASFNDMSTLHQYEDTFSFFLIQFAQMTLLMRSALESKDITHIRFAFSSAALEGDAVSCALRKKLSIRAGMAGINSDTSSRESSGRFTINRWN